MATGDLATCLRVWRDRAVVDAPDHRRRVSGLRRQEVADQAGVSLNYLIRLEQGHARSPSRLVIRALAKALQLSRDEHEHLQALAGHATSADSPTELPGAVTRLLDRSGASPVVVIDRAQTVVAANGAAERYLGGRLVGDNTARRQFLGHSPVTLEPQQQRQLELQMAGDLHRQLGMSPHDPGLTGIIDELNTSAPAFAHLWRLRPVAALTSCRKTVRHPTLGTFAIDCDVLEVPGSTHRAIVWSAPPGSPAAAALAGTTPADVPPPQPAV